MDNHQLFRWSFFLVEGTFFPRIEEQPTGIHTLLETRSFADLPLFGQTAGQLQEGSCWWYFISFRWFQNARSPEQHSPNRGCSAQLALMTLLVCIGHNSPYQKPGSRTTCSNSQGWFQVRFTNHGSGQGPCYEDGCLATPSCPHVC